MSKITKKQLQRDINNLATELTNLKIELLEKKVISDEPKPQLKQLDQSVFPLIERESVELTGSDLCRAMINRGDKIVLCIVRDYEHEDDIYYDAITYCSNDYFESTLSSWRYAVPINNQGEPLTASEVGL